MASVLRTKGIVLHEMPVNDHDKRILLFSKEYGKIVAFANGAKRVKSPLLAGTQPFVYGEFYLYPGRNSYSLKQVDIKDSFYELRQDMVSLYYGLYFLEVCNYVIQEEDPNEELLRLLYVSLSILRKGNDNPKWIRSIFEWRSLMYLGFSPDLSACSHCGATDGLTHLTMQGGVLCQKCFKEENTDAFSEQTIKVLRYLLALPLGKLYHVRMDPMLQTRVSKSIGIYFDEVMNYSFKTLAFIEGLSDNE